jgi:hypothetical protein
MTPMFAAALLLASTSGAQIRLTVGGDNAVGPGTRYPTLMYCNETPFPQPLSGWKFRTRDFAGFTTWMPGLSHAGAAPVEYTQHFPLETSGAIVSKACGIPIDYTGNLAKDQDGTPFDAQVLLKTGSCAERPSILQAPALACAGLAVRDSGYYANVCLETRSGSASRRLGGFIATFAGQTQIQAAIPSSFMTLSGNDVKWDPRSLRGPQYMMALAMAQEFLNVDMRTLAAIAAKEDQFAMVLAGSEARGSLPEWNGTYTNADGTFGPWEQDETAIANLVMAYPRFFPKHGPCASRYPDASSAASAGKCFGAGFSETAAYYMTTSGTATTGIHSPQLANAAFIASLGWLWLYDALAQSTDLYFAAALRDGADPRAILAAILTGYSLGRYSDFAAPLKDPGIVKDANGSARFPAGASNYRSDIYRVLDSLAASEAKSTACGGANPVYDTLIGFGDVQRFFFGGGPQGAPGTPEAQGDGGLLLHFDMTTAERAALLGGLQCAFTALKGKAPSSLGRDSVSYRYDWLSLLRVAKGLMPTLTRPVPVDHDFRFIVDEYSKNPVPASGLKSDSIFPILTLSAPRAPAADPKSGIGLEADFQARDDADSLRAEWTLDKDWVDWQPAEAKGGGAFNLRTPCAAKGFPAAGQKASLWVRATDRCGNATLQELPFARPAGSVCGDPVAIRTRIPPPGMGACRLAVRAGALRIESESRILRAAVYDAQGRLTAPPASGGGMGVKAMEIPLANLPRGIYAIALTTESGSSVQALPWMR